MDVALGSVAKGQIERKFGLFRAAAADAGRPDIPITMVAFGDPSVDILHHYAELGVERTVLGVSRAGWDDPATTMTFLDRYAEFVPELVTVA
jgi:hypothetical protein